MKPKLLMFDVDGTIVDSFQHGFKNAQRFIQEQTGEEISEDDYRDLIKGNPWENILQKVGIGVKDQMREADLPGFILPYQDNQLFDDIKSTLLKLSDAYPMVINTSTYIDVIMPVFEREGIDLLFSLYMGPEVSIYKDKKIELALQEYGLSSDQLVFVTDTVGDIMEAQKVGVNTVGVTWGFSTEDQLKEISPDFLVSNAKELESLLLSN